MRPGPPDGRDPVVRDTSAARKASVAGVTEIPDSCNECTVTETFEGQGSPEHGSHCKECTVTDMPDGRCVIVGPPRNTVPAHKALLLAPKNSHGSAFARKSVRPTTYVRHTSCADGVRPPLANCKLCGCRSTTRRRWRGACLLTETPEPESCDARRLSARPRQGPTTVISAVRSATFWIRRGLVRAQNG